MLYTTVYIFFIVYIVGQTFWPLLKPGHMSNRLEAIFYYPMEQFLLVIVFLLIFLYPILVILSLLSISKKVFNIEKIIKKKL